jgi:hypothetical protein
MEESIAREEIDCLCMVDLQLVLYDHDQFKDREGF